MGTLHEAYWLSDGLGQNRKERRSGAYQYYVPNLLSEFNTTMSTDTVSDIVRAETAIRTLNAEAKVFKSSEGLARLLLRAEAVSSSFIEGLQIGTKRLLKAELDFAQKGSLSADPIAVEIIANIHAMEDTIAQAESEKRVSVDTIKEIHNTLLKNTHLEEYGGIVRSQQNWIGGNWYNPLEAVFVPPAPEHVEKLLKDLAKYCNETLVSPVQQAAIAHAQFETIHPFVDGNGRTGRALIHLILRRRGLTPVLVPPISLVMATFSKAYVNGLMDYRYLDNEDSQYIQEKVNDWVSFFAGSCVKACEEANRFELLAQELQDSWREKLGKVRKESTVELLLDVLLGMPIFSYKVLHEATGRSLRAVIEAVDSFIQAGIVKASGSARRKETFEVPDVLRAYNLFERQLASPSGNTRTEKPNRPVPHRAK